MMAHLLRDYPQLRPFELQNVRLTGKRIGSGGYGSVEEGEIVGTKCAVKKIHFIFQDCPDAEFVKGCELLSNLRHPHVAQFLGISAVRGSRFPSLVMELLATNLHNLLETRSDIPLGLKHSVLYDVSRGISYLHSHSPPIVHRDLSARNVLLNSAMAAKIDLGVACILPSLRTPGTTKAPVACTYMPPEVLDDDLRCDVKTDIFSLGVVAIFTLAECFPQTLLPPTYTEVGRRVVMRTELERREEYMQKIYSQFRHDHPLVLMIKQCLHNYARYRPTIYEVVELLERAKAKIDDAECRMDRLALVQLAKDQTEQIESNEQHMLSKNLKIGALQKEQIKSKEQDLLKNRQIESKDREITRLTEENHKLLEQQKIFSEKTASDEQQITEMIGQLESKDQEIVHLMQKNQELAQQKEQDEGTLLEMKSLEEKHMLQVQDLTQQVHSLQEEMKNLKKPLTWPLQIRWRRGLDLPFGVKHAHTAVLNGNVYIGGGDASGKEKNERETNGCIVLKYDTRGECSMLPQCAVPFFALASVNGQLLLAGGARDSNSVFSLSPDKKCWMSNDYPKLRTGTASPAAVGYEKYLIVACGVPYKNSVEILDCSVHRWYRAEKIPMGGHFMTSVVVKKQLYISSYAWSDSKSHVFAADLPTLVSNATAPNRAKAAGAWQELPPPPVGFPTLLALKDHLLLTGGEGKRTELYRYEVERQQWTECGELPVGVWAHSCAVLPSGELFVAGGVAKGIGFSQQVWVGSFQGQ